MEHQSICDNIEDPDSEFHDALDQFPFVDASNSFDESISTSNEDNSTVTLIPNHSPESTSSSSSSSGLRRRQVFPPIPNKPLIENLKNHEKLDVGLTNIDKLDVGLKKNEKLEVGLQKNEKLDVGLTNHEKSEVGLMNIEKSDVGLKKNEKLEVGLQKNEKLDVGLKNNEKLDVGFKNIEKLDVGLTNNEKLDVGFKKNEKLDVGLMNNHELDENLNSTVVNRSSVTSIGEEERVNEESVSVDSPNATPNLLIIITQLVINVIGFQTKLLLSIVNFSVQVIYSSYMLFNNPYNIIRLGRSGIWGICYNTGVKLINYLKFQSNESALNSCARIGWALLWVAYCGFILVCLLVSALVVSGVIVKRVVEEPVRITEQLVFDYTKDAPVAFAPVVSCNESALLVRKEKSKIGRFVGTRVVPVGHELKATVSLVLPESDYNRKLGIFQVRVDFLSSDNKVLTTTRKPSMLQFKSDPIRLLSTFLKLPSLLTGYPSETQTLDININGYTEKDIPLSCLRVVIEQRAEFAKGAGVPEIYSAVIKLESRFSFLKRMLWYWKWLIYMWISMMMFAMELLFTVLCCTPVIFPWVRRAGGYSVNIASHSRNKPPG